MSKWNKWKLIHQDTHLTFKQYYKSHKITDNNGHSYDYSELKLIPVLLQSGLPAVYVDEPYYPYMFFLNNKEWKIEITLAKNE